MRAPSRGFSLLEVIVAVAILGLGLTTILSAQAGLFSASTRGANMTRASNLARCKMSEVEVVLARDGFPLSDEKDDGHCCENEDDNGFRCHWLVETIKLPELNSLDGGTEDGGVGRLSGPAGSLAGLKMDGGLNLSGGSGLSALGAGLPGLGSQTGASSGLGAMGGGLGGIASMALTMVYPSVKPMLEASIRRVTVKVSWFEGTHERSFEIGQYLTNPQQGGMLPGMPGYDPAAAAAQMMGLPTGTTGAATGAATGATTGATTGAAKSPAMGATK